MRATVLLQRPHLCGGTQRNTAKRLYTGTQYVVVVNGHSNKMLSEAHMRVYNCARDHKMRLMQLFPLGLHAHGMRATHLFVRKVLQGCCKKLCRVIPSGQPMMLYHTGQG